MSPSLVEVMQFVKKEMELHHVLAAPLTIPMEILIVHVRLNACPVQIVLLIRHALIINVVILVRALAA